MSTYDKLVNKYNYTVKKYVKLELNLAKSCYKMGMFVKILLSDGTLVIPHTYKQFKQVYKIEQKLGNIENVMYGGYNEAL